MDWQPKMDGVVEDDLELALYDSMDGPSEEEVYLAGVYFGVLVVLTAYVTTHRRRVQDNLTACWRAFPWKDRETSYGPCH